MWGLYLVGLLNLGLLFGYFGWEAGLYGFIVAVMFWAAGVTHERYVYR